MKHLASWASIPISSVSQSLSSCMIHDHSVSTHFDSVYTRSELKIATYLYCFYCSSAVEPNATFHVKYNSHLPKYLLLGICNKQILGVSISQKELLPINVMNLPS